MFGSSLFINGPAHEQVGEKTGIPRDYYKRCLAEAPGLLTENVNYWLAAAEGENRLVRVTDGTVRAFLSSKYRVLNHLDVVSTILEVAMEAQADLPTKEREGHRAGVMTDATGTFFRGGHDAAADGAALAEAAKVDRIDLSETNLRFGVVQPGLERNIAPPDAKDPDPIWPGITITNSETGHGGLTVRPRIFRVVCKNALVADQAAALGLRQIHIGRTLTESFFISAETSRMENAVIFAKVRDIARGLLLGGEWWEKAVEAFRKAGTTRLPGEIVEPVVAGIVAERNLTIEDRKKILARFIEGGMPTLGNLINAFTFGAHESENLDTCEAFEGAGGDLLYSDEADLAGWKAQGEAVFVRELKAASAKV